MAMDNLTGLLQNNRLHFIGEDTAFRSAVMVPLVKVENEWHVLFEIRSLKLKKQPGDISFPGGRIDPGDASPMAAALRETAEELQITADKIRVLGELSPYIANPSFAIYPFVGIVEYDTATPTFSEDEVSDVFTVPLRWLLESKPYMHVVSAEPVPEKDFPYDKIMNGADYKWRKRISEEWFFDYGERTIWGITARILKHFLDILRTGDELPI